MTGNKRFVNNADQQKCPRCGAYISTKDMTETEIIQRIECSNHNTGTNKITLYGEERI